TAENGVARHEPDAPNTGVLSRNHCTHNVRAPERRNRREGAEHEQNEHGAHLSLLKRHGPSSFPANGFTRTLVPAPCRRGTYIAPWASCQAFFNPPVITMLIPTTPPGNPGKWCAVFGSACPLTTPAPVIDAARAKLT